MKTVNISYLKNNLSAIIANLQHSGRIDVVDRDKPVAILFAYSHPDSNATDTQKLKILQKAGIVELPANLVPEGKRTLRPAPLSKVVDAVAMLIEDRERGY